MKSSKENEKKNINNSINMNGLKSSFDRIDQDNLMVTDNGLGFPENFDFRNNLSGDAIVNIIVE